MKIIALFLGILFALHLNLSGDKINLVKLQKKEKERLERLRKKKQAAKKTERVTNKNLKAVIKAKKGPYSFIEVKQRRKIKMSDDKGEGGLDSKGQGEGYWRNLKMRLVSQIAELKLVIRANENEMARLRGLYNGTLLLSAQLKYMKEFNSLGKKVHNDKMRLKRLEKELEELPDKARKAGVPPGWIR